MDIDHFIAFGFPADIQAIKEKIYKKFVYSGGVNPVLLKDGSTDEIVDEIERYIDMFIETGSYILGDGASIAPGTPPANINLFAETAEKYMINNKAKE
jgi:uroporphyrinogen-III decarboxylase